MIKKLQFLALWTTFFIFVLSLLSFFIIGLSNVNFFLTTVSYVVGFSLFYTTTSKEKTFSLVKSALWFLFMFIVACEEILMRITNIYMGGRGK